MPAAKSTVTPMMAQYLEIKSEYPDALLFYRMGDFYEMFFEDAVNAAEALDIALTKRGKHEGKDIPMCGVPVHAAEGYFLTLIRKGFRVAVCEQLESPAEAKKRGYKAVVKRGVVRLVTPGTLTEDSLLNARLHNFLAAYAQIRDDCALAWVDISTGRFQVAKINAAQLAPELARLAPSEILVSEANEESLRELVSDFGISMTPLSRGSFDSQSGDKRLCTLFDVQSLDAFGTFDIAEISAMGALVDYLEITQKGKLPLLQPPSQEALAGIMQIDAATRRNLELTQALSGGRAGSLLAILDHTVTAGGARLLERRLASPSCALPTITDRQDAVTFCVNDAAFANALRDDLRKVPDLERSLSRLGLDRGGPRDLAAIRNALTQAETLFDRYSGIAFPNALQTTVNALNGHDDLLGLLDAALIADPPLLARDGGFIAAGYDEELDEARTLRDEGRGVIAGMQQQFAELTGITSIKIKHNNVLGYFVETPATHADKMMSPPLSETFIHRQTTANQVRFTTVELSDLEARILNAGARALEIEKRLYNTLKDAILAQSASISVVARSLAELDWFSTMGDIARAQDWCRPTIDTSRAFKIKGGRHPVVEAALAKSGGDQFVANNAELSATSDNAAIWLLTGPNMSGKSTFLRQNALIAILAQTGAYVPAKSAHIGIVSQVFSRVGASDDLARGRSTFMVEMVETAAILNQSDDRALVILDEIGRGTATYDGLSIAWATLEYLHNVNKCRALFATHYHEMTGLSETLGGVENATVRVKEWEGEVVFLHEVVQGAADRSYGVQVAKLAGLPPAVIARAEAVLEKLEAKGNQGPKTALMDELPLFSAAIETHQPVSAPTNSMVDEILHAVHPDDLSPREALEVLYKLKEASQ